MCSGECFKVKFISYTQCFNRSVKLFTRREDIDAISRDVSKLIPAANLRDVRLHHVLIFYLMLLDGVICFQSFTVEGESDGGYAKNQEKAKKGRLTHMDLDQFSDRMQQRFYQV